MTAVVRRPTTNRHPLEPLTEDEIRAATNVLRNAGRLGGRMMICSSALFESDDATLQDGYASQRQAFVTLLDRASGDVFEAVVALSAGDVVSWTHVPGVQPGMTSAELGEATELVKRDPDFQAALAKRGVTDMSLVAIDCWPNGNFGFAEDNSRRLTRALAWVHRNPGDNAYARPLEGVIAVVDLNSMEVVRVEDHGVVALPDGDSNYAAALVPNQRTDIKPLEIHQPDGPSFEVEGHVIRWQKWQIRFGFTHREGLVLYNVGYQDGGRLRGILRRASLSEMVVPYGDPAPMHNRKNAFDAGEYGLGMCTNSLELGCDCLGEIRYFDGILAAPDGEPYTIKNAICLHEEDHGILWKHVDRDTGTRSSALPAAGAFEHRHRGQLRIRFLLVLLPGRCDRIRNQVDGHPLGWRDRRGRNAEVWHVVSPGVYAPIHQHFFSLRLDFGLDDGGNSVYEVNTVAEPLSDENAFGNAFFAESTLLSRESEARRRVNQETARYWRIANPSSLNAVGQPVSYKLMPMENCLPMNLPGSSLIRRAGFTTNHLWVTPYDRHEMHAAGQYPNQHPGGAGLPEWTAADRNIEDTARRGLVHAWPQPHPSTRGLAGDADVLHGVQTAAGWLL